MTATGPKPYTDHFQSMWRWTQYAQCEMAATMLRYAMDQLRPEHKAEGFYLHFEAEQLFWIQEIHRILVEKGYQLFKMENPPTPTAVTETRTAYLRPQPTPYIVYLVHSQPATATATAASDAKVQSCPTSAVVHMRARKTLEDACTLTEVLHSLQTSAYLYEIAHSNRPYTK
jgi:hypothetical protein